MSNKSVRGGMVLVAIGILFLIFQFVDFGENFILPLLGAGFITWSIVGRVKGLMIPGGILSGIALGTTLQDSGLATQLEGDASGALFLLGFAAGWFTITLFTYLFFSDFQWWPMIPGAIMALIGAGILLESGALQSVSAIGRFWPVILIAVGVYVMWNQFRKEEAEMLGAEEIYEKSPQDLAS